MNRRNVIKSLSALAIGSYIIGGCQVKDLIWEEGATQIQIGSTPAEFIQTLSQLILPSESIQYTTPEPLTQYIETMVNDCSTKQQIIDYGKGYKEYQLFMKEKLNKDIDHLSEDEVAQLFDAVNDEETMPLAARYFFSQTRKHCISHFTTSEYYLTNHTKYEMVPSRFDGCMLLS
jgi:hypothetical protein